MTKFLKANWKELVRHDGFYNTRTDFIRSVTGLKGSGKAVVEDRKLGENISLNDKTRQFVIVLTEEYGDRRAALMEIARLCVLILTYGHVKDVTRLHSTGWYDHRTIYEFIWTDRFEYGQMYLKAGYMDDGKLHVVIHPSSYETKGYLA